MKAFFSITLFLTTVLAFSKDKGRGVFYVSSEVKGKIEISIYERSNFKSKELGVFIYDYIGNGETKFSVRAKNLKEDNLLEFEYERLGLPLCELSGNWIKVIYGYDQSGKVLIGWVESREAITGYFLWPDYFKNTMLFFESPDQIKFFDKPNGVVREFELIPSQHLKYDYIMKPLEISDEWMKVEVTTPSDYCDTPENKTTGIFWIKFLSKDRRPLVWYFTRGC
jgi:hypothetical protein